ncbi:MAG: dATP/dGTP diphosphohydrolase domain-containing protein [Gammaproteobacteria bacterium]
MSKAKAIRARLISPPDPHGIGGDTPTDYDAERSLGIAPETAAGGIKHDGGKPAMHLIPPEALDALAEVLGFGAKKYAPRNWESGLLYSRVFAASARHLWAWWRGEDRDSETGFSHLDHALTCVAFLVSYERREMASFDDRPRNGV